MARRKTHSISDPYELGRALRERGDARSITFNHGSLYMVVGQLAKAGFIVERETTRAGQRPERTVYALTDAGRQELRDWLRELVEEPQHEYPQFVAALSLIAALPPSEVLMLLRSGTGKRLGESRTGRSLPDGTTSQTIKRADLYRVPHAQALARDRDRCLGGGTAGIALVRTRYPGRPPDATEFGMARTESNIPILAET